MRNRPVPETTSPTLHLSDRTHWFYQILVQIYCITFGVSDIPEDIHCFIKLSLTGRNYKLGYLKMNECSILLKHFTEGNDEELLKSARSINEQQVINSMNIGALISELSRN